MKKKDLNIDAVLDRDLVGLLNELSLMGEIDAGSLTCPLCEKVITLQNLGALRIVDAVVTLYCDDFGCIPGM